MLLADRSPHPGTHLAGFPDVPSLRGDSIHGAHPELRCHSIVRRASPPLLERHPNGRPRAVPGNKGRSALALKAAIRHEACSASVTLGWVRTIAHRSQRRVSAWSDALTSGLLEGPYRRKSTDPRDQRHPWPSILRRSSQPNGCVHVSQTAERTRAPWDFRDAERIRQSFRIAVPDLARSVSSAGPVAASACLP